MSSIDSAIDLNAGSVSENVKTMLRGELVLAFAVIINSLGVVLMLYSGTGISAISSVPYAFSEVFPKITLGTFTYMFQGLLVLSLMILRRSSYHHICFHSLSDSYLVNASTCTICGFQCSQLQSDSELRTLL